VRQKVCLPLSESKRRRLSTCSPSLTALTSTLTRDDGRRDKIGDHSDDNENMNPQKDEEEYDEEVYDDKVFYSSLLKVSQMICDLVKISYSYFIFSPVNV
jgi:hypothetical protein